MESEMGLIEQFGGYEATKEYLKKNSHFIDFEGLERFYDELLEYRRQHNIFEVGDKVVSVNSAFIEYQGVLNIDFIAKFDLTLSDGSKGFEVNTICGWGDIIRHATSEEIEAGRRL